MTRRSEIKEEKKERTAGNEHDIHRDQKTQNSNPKKKKNAKKMQKKNSFRLEKTNTLDGPQKEKKKKKLNR